MMNTFKLSCGTSSQVAPYSDNNLANMLQRFETPEAISAHIAKHPRSLNDVDKDQKTVLMWAVECGRTDVITSALQYGVKIDAVDNNGWSAAMYAARRGSLPIMEMLLEYGCDLSLASSDDEFTALHLAAGNEAMDMCIALIKAGANPNAKDIDGRPPAFYLKLQKNKGKLQDLMDVTYKEGMTKTEVRKRSNSGGNAKYLSIDSAASSYSSGGPLSRMSRIDAALSYTGAEDVSLNGSYGASSALTHGEFQSARASACASVSLYPTYGTL